MASKCDDSNWQFNKNACERNEHMLKNGLATNVTFGVSATPKEKPTILKAHTYMLISASPVFWSMLCGDMKEPGDVIVSDVHPDAFQEMLRQNEAITVLYEQTTNEYEFKIEIGHRVCVKQGIAQLVHVWGKLKPGDIGIVKRRENDYLRVDFPSNKDCGIRADELDLA